MNTIRNNFKTKYIGYAVSFIMLVLAIMQFLPYWRYQGEDLSIAAYIWRPYAHGTFTDLFKAYFGRSFKVTLMFALPMALTLVANTVGSLFCIIKNSKKYVYLVPFFSGLLGIYCFHANPAYQLGGTWIIHLALYYVICILGILGFILGKNRNS